MHKNLEAELARRSISKREYAKHLKINYSTLFRKLSGDSPFTINEAFRTAKLLALTANDISYLFADEFEAGHSVGM